MIKTGHDGRRRSERTFEEDVVSVRDAFALLPPEARSLLQGLIDEAHIDFDVTKNLEAEIKKSLYRSPPVSALDFITDPYYIGDSMTTIYPRLRDDYIAMFAAPYREVILTGGVGVGKTYVASAAICRVLYELSCLKDPQRTFGMSPGSEMVIMLISKNLILAREVMKTAVDDKIKLSPYFMQNFVPKFSTDYTLFPNNIRLTIGSYGAERALGANVFSAFLDECFGIKNILTFRDSCGNILDVTVGELWAMGSAFRDGLLVEALDHETGAQAWTRFRMRKSTVQPLVRIVAEGGNSSSRVIEVSQEHPFLVRRNDWLIYIPAEDVAVGDEVVCESNRSTHSHEEGSHKYPVDGRDIGGCRSECIRVSDLPGEFELARVISTCDLPAEQTYSIETDCKTLVAEGFVVHNTNFPPKRSAQQIMQTMGKSLTAANFDIVEKVYRSLVRRIKSRFQVAGGDFPGMVLLVSSAATVDSFTERKLRDARSDPSVFVRDHTAWTAKPKDLFCGKQFFVLCSKSSLRSRILEEGEHELVTDEFLRDNDAWVVDVPVEYKEDFEANLEDSLRDIAGISTQAISAFFQRVESVDACVKKERSHPFSSEWWVAGAPGTFEWSQMCRKFERKLPGGFTEEAWAPIEAPKAPRWVHIDVSVSGDSTGFAIGRVDRWVEVVRRDGDGNRFTDVAPYFVIEVMLMIRPPPGEQIYLPDIRRLVYELQAHGYPIVGVSTDTYQFVEMHQQLRRKGLRAEILSLDRTTEGYDELKSAIYERRIEYYKYEPFLRELKSLEYDRVKGKVDHPRHCFAGETRVALVDGTCPTFCELADRTGPFYVYAIGPDGVCVAVAEDACLTMSDAEVIEVLLDNYQTVRCTPDHLFMTLDGEWVQAQYLTPDVRLMPLYRTCAARGGTLDYERVWCPIRRDRLLTHRLAAGLPANGFVVHHIDGNKANNDPRNLSVMDRRDHYRHHGNALWEHRKAAMQAGHRRYVEQGGGNVSRDVICRTWASGKFGPPRADCSIEGCANKANARGLCDMHYQRARRAGVLPERMEKMEKNHRVLRVDRTGEREAVYDLSVPELHNFALATGVFVHNCTKDVSDAVAGVVLGLKKIAARLPLGAEAGTTDDALGHEYGWVSPLIPANMVDVESVRMASERNNTMDFLPPLFMGDD